MDDEIDIEEHDVLDNPAIKRIFPDLTILKQEVLYDFDENYIAEQNVSKDNIVPKLEDSSETLSIAIKQDVDEEHNVYNGNAPFIGNKIILGSKPNKDRFISNVCNKTASVYNTTVPLKNIKPYLDSCKRYCELCLILFPTEEAFEIHEKFFHSHPITQNLERNMYSENTRKHSNNVSVNTCNICNNTFSTLSNLKKHLRNIHSQKRIKKANGKHVPKPAGSCFHCNIIFPNVQTLIEHLYDTLGTKKTNEIRNKNALYNKRVFKDVEHSITEKNETVQKQNLGDNVRKVLSENELLQLNESETFVYRCTTCSYYFKNVKIFARHMFRKHSIKDPPSPKKISFDPKCKFCSSEFLNVTNYNTHIRKVHGEVLYLTISKKKVKPKRLAKLDKASEKDVPVKISTLTKMNDKVTPPTLDTKENRAECILKSALFRCNRCDTHFLNSQVAIDHVSHMEILINWKCSICKRIFKKNDEKDHMVQHSVTDDFTVYGISESTPSLILYNCPKCSVHFDENKFYQHFSVCETISIDHVKCKFCGILMDSNLACLHNSHHQKGNVKTPGFITVKTDIIQKNTINQDSNRNNSKDSTRSDIELRPRNVSYDTSEEENKMFKVYYCKTCKCFVNENSVVRHKNLRCKNEEEPIVCILCGLIYPRKSTSSHARHHTKKIDLTLQDFEFCDLNSKLLINPPIPKFPQCTACQIHFPRKNSLYRHYCGTEEYTTCSTCDLKFSELGYKLHMNYHELTSSHCKELTNTTETSNKLMTHKYTEINNNILIYTCNHCHMSLSNYDLVIEHCQEHLNSDNIQPPEGMCKSCNLVFDAKFNKNHEEIHLKTFDKNKLKTISFDTHGFKTDYKAWIKKVFITLPQEQSQNIVEKSIYKDENKIKMQIIQEGSCDVTLYKCYICNCYVDPLTLIKHLGIDCRTLRHHTCKVCYIPFVSHAFKSKHEAIHNQPFKGLKSCRIILFNRNEDEEDESLNGTLDTDNSFTLYKCSKCNGIVNKNEQEDHLCNKRNLKVCPHCKLFIYSKDFNLHLCKHKKFDTFVSKNIKVIVFERCNEKEVNRADNDEECPSKRMRYDYEIYKCNECQTCISDEESSRKHVCSLGHSKSKCSVCGLYWEKSKLKDHYALHKSDRNFVVDNITIINIENKNTDTTFMKNNKTEFTAPSHVEVLQNTNLVQKKVVTAKLYRCSCGLHFLDNKSIKAHHNDPCRLRNKINVRQQCSKCGLPFNPNVLFKHLVEHHGNKDVTYKYDIIDVTRKKHKKS